MAYKFDLSKGEEILLKVASVGAAVLGVVAVYSFYKNNIWQPRVYVKSVDFKNGVAELEVNGKPFILRGDSSFLIAFDWGIKFGTTYKSNGVRVYDRIEILKRNLVHKIVREAGEVHFTGFNEETFWNDAFEGNKGGLAVQKSFTGDEKKIDDVFGVKDSNSFSLFQDK